MNGCECVTCAGVYSCLSASQSWDEISTLKHKRPRNPWEKWHCSKHTANKRQVFRTTCRKLDKDASFGRLIQTLPDSNTWIREYVHLCHGGAGICYGLADVLVISGDVDLSLQAWHAASAFSKGETSKPASNRIAAVTFLLLLHRGESAKYKTSQRYEDITLMCDDCAEIHTTWAVCDWRVGRFDF